MKKIIFILFILIATSAHAQTSGTINRLDQWAATTSPVNAITQRVFGKSLYFTGFTDGCLSLVSGILTSSGTACGAGGGGSSGGTWSTTTSQVANRLINYPNNATDIVAIGSNATTTAKFFYDPNTLIGHLKGFFGIGTTSPYAPLSVVGAGGVVAEKFTATSTTATSTFAGNVGIGTSSPAYGKFNSGLTLGLNENIVLTTNRNTNNFVGNIIFKNEQASTTKSGLEWYGYLNPTVSRAWLVFHESLNGELDGSHGAPHLEIETSDVSGAKQGRWTVQSDCDYDCIQTFNQSEVYITRNSGQTNGNLLFNGGGQLRNTGVMQIIPNNALNTKGFRIATSTDNDIMIDVTSGTELEIQDTVNLTGNQYISGLLGIGTTSPANQITVEKSGASGTTVGPTLELRQNQTAINTTQNSNIGEILFSGADIFPNETGVGAKIRAEATNIWNGTTNDYPTSLLFFTNPNGSEALREVMRATDTGFVGIGTTSPYAKLSVVGDVVATNFYATSTTASSTFANGINITGGCFAKNGVCLTSGSGGSSASTTLLSDMNTFSTTGTTTFKNAIRVSNYLSAGVDLYGGTYPELVNAFKPNNFIADFAKDIDDYVTVNIANHNAGTSASADLTFNNNLSYDTDGDGFSNYYADCGLNSSNYNVPSLGLLSQPNGFYCYNTDGPVTILSATSTGFIQFGAGGYDTESMRIQANGFVGIGTISPVAKLTITNSASDNMLYIESEELDATPTVLTNADFLGIGTSSPWTKLSVNGIGAMDSIYTTNTTATSTFKGKIDTSRLTSATLRLTGLTNCTEALETDPYGNVVCGTDVSGAGGSVTGNGIAGMMASWSSSSNLIATSTIIGNQLIATSTTATSTIAGALAIGGATPDANFSVKGIGGKVMQIFTSASTKIMDIANDGIVTLLGVWNFGDATSLEIPNSDTPTYGARGILSLDTNANNLTIATSTLGHQVVWSATTTLYSFSMASTSPYFVNGATKMLPSKSLQQVVTTIWCKVDGGTSKVINLSDGTNDTNSVTCTTTGSEYPITTNATFTPAETINLEMGATTGTVNDLIIDIKGYRTSN